MSKAGSIPIGVQSESPLSLQTNRGHTTTPQHSWAIDLKVLPTQPAETSCHIGAPQSPDQHERVRPDSLGLTRQGRVRKQERWHARIVSTAASKASLHAPPDSSAEPRCEHRWAPGHVVPRLLAKLGPGPEPCALQPQPEVEAKGAGGLRPKPVSQPLRSAAPVDAVGQRSNSPKAISTPRCSGARPMLTGRTSLRNGPDRAGHPPDQRATARPPWPAQRARRRRAPTPWPPWRAPDTSPRAPSPRRRALHPPAA